MLFLFAADGYVDISWARPNQGRINSMDDGREGKPTGQNRSVLCRAWKRLTSNEGSSCQCSNFRPATSFLSSNCLLMILRYSSQCFQTVSKQRIYAIVTRRFIDHEGSKSWKVQSMPVCGGFSRCLKEVLGDKISTGWRKRTTHTSLWQHKRAFPIAHSENGVARIH